MGGVGAFIQAWVLCRRTCDPTSLAHGEQGRSGHCAYGTDNVPSLALSPHGERARAQGWSGESAHAWESAFEGQGGGGYGGRGARVPVVVTVRPQLNLRNPSSGRFDDTG